MTGLAATICYFLILFGPGIALWLVLRRRRRELKETAPRVASISPFTGELIATGSEPLTDAAVLPNNDGHAGFTKGNTEGLPLM